MTSKSSPEPKLPRCKLCGHTMRLGITVPMLFCNNTDCDATAPWDGDWEGDVRYHYEAPGYNTPQEIFDNYEDEEHDH